MTDLRWNDEVWKRVKRETWEALDAATMTMPAAQARRVDVLVASIVFDDEAAGVGFDDAVDELNALLGYDGSERLGVRVEQIMQDAVDAMDRTLH
jgi:hypothetical protein